MKYRLTMLMPVKGDEVFGSSDIKYQEAGVIHAERVKISGRSSEEAGEHFSDYHSEWNVRDAHPVKEGWRVAQLGGVEWNVTNVIPNLDKGYKTLICDKVNK